MTSSLNKTVFFQSLFSAVSTTAIVLLSKKQDGEGELMRIFLKTKGAAYRFAVTICDQSNIYSLVWEHVGSDLFCFSVLLCFFVWFFSVLTFNVFLCFIFCILFFCISVLLGFCFSDFNSGEKKRYKGKKLGSYAHKF